MIKLARLSRWGHTIPKPFMMAGLALLLGGCPSGNVQAPQTIDFGEADELQIQPIQVCDDNGQNCARVNLFEDFTRRILEQARLKVSFLPTNRLNASRFLRIDDNPNRSSPDYEFYEISRTGGSGAFGRNPNSTRETGPINVWFVNEIESAGGFTQFGLAWVDANGVLISEDALDFGGSGRVDTIAHEISHNLGLRHADIDARSPNNIAAEGDIRNIPSSLDDIGTVSILTEGQISEIKRSPLVTNSGSGNSSEEVEAADVVSSDAVGELGQLVAAQPEGGLVNQFTQQLGPSSAASNQPAKIPEPAALAGLSLLGLGLFRVHRRPPSERSPRG